MLDRLRKAFDAAVRGTLPEVDYHALYWARIVKQSGAFVDVEPERDGLPDMAGVPLTIGWNGSSEGAAGGRVLVGWSGGDPSKPFAMGFEQGTTSTKAVWNCLALYLGGEAGAQPATMGDVQKAINDAIVLHVHPGVTVGAGVTGPSATLATLPDPRASKVKVV